MKHSNLNTADKLHYAKVRTFTGDPALVSPDFADQILVATDTNKIYRATGTTTGQLTQTISEVEQTNQTQLVGSVLGLQTTPVEVAPLFVGQTFFDIDTQTDWIAVHTRSIGGWVEKGYRWMVYAQIQDFTAGKIFAGQSIEIYFVDTFTPEFAQGGQSLINADKMIAEYQPSLAITINPFVFPQGKGVFLLAPKNWAEGFADLYSVNLDVSPSNQETGFITPVNETLHFYKDFYWGMNSSSFKWANPHQSADDIKIDPLYVTIKIVINDIQAQN